MINSKLGICKNRPSKSSKACPRQPFAAFDARLTHLSVAWEGCSCGGVCGVCELMHLGGGGTFVGEISLEITTFLRDLKSQDEPDDFEELKSCHLYHDGLDIVFI